MAFEQQSESTLVYILPEPVMGSQEGLKLGDFLSCQIVHNRARSFAGTMTVCTGEGLGGQGR